jgi:hypothetical protein
MELTFTPIIHVTSPNENSLACADQFLHDDLYESAYRKEWGLPMAFTRLHGLRLELGSFETP